MVFFNYATMQMAAKIVYYGPGLCGKTTNLHHIYTKTSPQSRGEMVSLETETDRTLFFDLLPIDVGVIGGFKTRLQLYTIPGQVFYNTTRKLVLKGVDGLVFVADSQQPMFDANLDSYKNLRENLAEIGLDLEDIPLVVQLNKRDLPNVASVESLLDALDPERKSEYVEAIAATGEGVFETLKLISKLTLRTLRRRMTGEEAIKPAPRKGLADITSFRVKDEKSPPRPTPSAPQQPPTTAIGVTAQTSPGFATSGTAAAASSQGATTAVAEDLSDLLRDVNEAEAAPALEMQSEPAQSIAGNVTPPPPPSADREIDFNQSEKSKAPKVKHVKVRSSIDVMAELEALRKKATQTTPKAKKQPAHAPTRPAGRELHKAINLTVPAEALAEARAMRVTVSFEDGEEGVIQQQSEKVELGDSSDMQSIALNLRIDRS